MKKTYMSFHNLITAQLRQVSDFYKNLNNKEVQRVKNYRVLTESWPCFTKIIYLLAIYYIIKVAFNYFQHNIVLNIFSQDVIIILIFIITLFFQISEKIFHYNDDFKIKMFNLIYFVSTILELIIQQQRQQIQQNFTMEVSLIFCMIFLIQLLFWQRYLALNSIVFLLIIVKVATNFNHFSTTDLESSIGGLITLIILLFYQELQYIKIGKIISSQLLIMNNLPNGICILNEQGNYFNYVNENFYVLMMEFDGRNRAQSISQFKERELLLNSFQIDKNMQNKINRFLKKIKIGKLDLLNQFIYKSEDFENQTNGLDDLVDLNIVLTDIAKIDQNVGNSFQFKAIIDKNIISYDNLVEFKDSILEIRIKKDIVYNSTKGILVSFFDISKNFESLYYKNMNQFKGRLIRSISHELRTRLNMIQGIIEILISDAKKHQFTVDVLEKLQITFNNCQIQAVIIGSIIDYNLIQEKKFCLKPEKFQIKKLLDDVVELFQMEIQNKNIKLDLQYDVLQYSYIQLDYQKLFAVLVHLIANSIKFTDNYGTINIVLTKDFGQDQNLYGINQENQKGDIQSQLKKFDKYDEEVEEQKQLPHEQDQIILSPNNGSQQQLNKQFSSFSKLKLNKYDQSLENEITYYIKIIDSGIGMKQEKLEEVKRILRDEIHTQTEDEVQSESFMMGMRIVGQFMKKINQKNGEWVHINSLQNQGTSITLTLLCNLAQKSMNQFSQNKYQIQKSSSIIDEGLVQPIKDRKTHNIDHFQYRQQLKSLPAEQQLKCNDVIIVDDEAYNLLVLSTLLKNQNQIVTQALNGQECVTLIQQRIQKVEQCGLINRQKVKLAKLIIMDYQMPKIDGSQATRQIRSLIEKAKIQQIPIIGCTGFSAPETIEELMLSGMNDVCVKPITGKMLKMILEKVEDHEYDF